MDGPETGTVTGGHVGVEGPDGIGTAHLTVLLVHVVGARARVVADPDAEVLDLLGVLLVDLQKVFASAIRPVFRPRFVCWMGVNVRP